MSPPAARRVSTGYLLSAVALAAAYFVVGELSLGARTLTPSVSPLWPASGLGLAAALVWRVEAATAGVFLGAAAVALSLRLPPLVVATMALANAFEVYAAAWVLERSGLDGHSFYHPRDFSIYAALTAATTAVASATVVLALRQVRLLEGHVAFVYFTRLLAHWSAMLIVSPALLLWRFHPRLTGKSRHLAEGAALAGATLGICWLLFAGSAASRAHLPLSYLLLPLALWPAVRLGLRETASVLLVLAAAALWGTVKSLGPFASVPADGAVTVLQGFLAVAALVSMTLASAVWRAKDDGKALAEARARLAAITDVVPAVIAHVGASGRYAFVNRFTEVWLGRPASQILGKTMEEVLGPETYAPLKDRVEAAMAGATQEFETALTYGWGEKRWIKVVYTPTGDEKGARTGFVILVLDLTERRRAESQLEEAQHKLLALNAQLEDRVRERTARLRQVNDELESFCYSVAHDLRSPLRKMSGFSEAVLHDYAAKLDPRGAGYLTRIFDASRRMGRLIDEMLDLSMVTRAEARDELVDLTGAARGVLEDLRHAEPDRDVEIVVAEGLSARGDPALLEAALRNLIENAWKFTRPKPRARIEIGMRPQEPSPVFFVRDDGVGFDMAHAQRLFGAFERLHPLKDFPGSGIGLATVQRVIQRHGGRVWAEGHVGTGACFSFTLHERP